MCNRIAIPSTLQLKRQYRGLILTQDDFPEQFHSNGYDHDVVPIITTLQPPLVKLSRWGYLPENAHSPEQMKGYDTLNARSETLFQSPLYQEAARSRRCVLFVNGFFEFKHFKGKKYPHFIGKKGGKTFTFGGVWSQWKDLLTCTIITTPANPLLASIHNQKLRMPFVIPEEDWEPWLVPDQPEDVLQDLMQPYPMEDLVAWQVGNRLTQKGVEKNTPEVQVPIGPVMSKAPFPDPAAAAPEVTKAPRRASRKTPKPPSPQLGLF